MELIHTEPRESEEAAEIVRGLGWLLHNDQLEAGSFAGMCNTALGAGAQFHRRQFNRTVCVHGEVPVGMIALGIVGPGANAAKFWGRRITSDAIYVLTHGDEGVLYAPANHLFTISCVSHEALDRALQTLAQTSISRFSHTGSLPVPAAFMPPLRRVLDEACMPSPFPDHVLVERAISALCLILTAAGPMSRTSLAARNHQRYVRKARATFVTIRANRQDSKPSAVSLAWAHEPLKRLSEKSSVSARYNSTRFVDSTLRGMCSRMPILKRPASKVLQPATAFFTLVASRAIIRVSSAKARR
jgi:hypothetical protein